MPAASSGIPCSKALQRRRTSCARPSHGVAELDREARKSTGMPAGETELAVRDQLRTASDERDRRAVTSAGCVRSCRQSWRVGIAATAADCRRRYRRSYAPDASHTLRRQPDNRSVQAEFDGAQNPAVKQLLIAGDRRSVCTACRPRTRLVSGRAALSR